jgi:hypothetical protein
MTDPATYQYQFCGVEAFPNTFTVNSSGTSNGVYGVFEGFHADFASSVYAVLYRNGMQIDQSPESPTNQQLAVDQMINFFPGTELQAGDEIEFVLHDQTDPNGQQFFSSKNYLNNSDKMNHTWAESMLEATCAPGQTGNCVFAGFEDIPSQEGSDFDYNDFKMWLYGVDVSPQPPAVPEPSSMLLLSGTPLAFLLNKLRKLF